MITQIEIPKSQTIDKKTSDAIQFAQQISIVDDVSNASAGAFLSTLKEIQREIDATFDGPIKSAHEAHKAIVAAKKTHSEPLVNAEAIAKKKMVAYHNEQEQKRIAEEKRMRDEQQRKMDAERETKAKELIQAGKVEEAYDTIEAPVEEAPMFSLPVAPKVAGVSFREVWKFEVTDIRALARAVADGKVPVSAIEPNNIFLGQQARSMKGELGYAGVRTFSEKTAGVR